MSTISGASSVVFIRLIETNQMAMGFYRLGFSVLLFAVPILLGGYKYYKELTSKDYLYCVLAGFFLFCHFFCWFTAVKNTAIASAAILFSLNPLMLLLVTTVFFKQRVNAKAVAGIFVALAGGAIIAGFDYGFEGSHTAGNVAAFMAAVFFAAYFLVGRAMRTKIPAVNYIFLVFGSCWIFFTIAMLITNTPFSGYRAQDYIGLFIMAMVCQGIAHAMYNWCMGYVSSLYMSVWVSVESVFAIAFGAAVFREFPALWQYIGGIIAIFGLVYYNYNCSEESKGRRHDV
ncbi:MAG: DMT family transporter [Synergistaceae bacterium]|nr:DMT family transporter [Synergistaceae bacterium]